MKTRKILAVLLAVVVLVGSLAVVSSAAPTIDTKLVKTAYYDWEYFNPQGLVVMDGVTPVTYSADNEDFKFIPSLDELMTVETKAVRVIYKNEEIGTILVTVEHSFGDIEYLGATGHGARCKGCGKVDVVEAHQAELCPVYDEKGNPTYDADGNPIMTENWIPNDDGGLFVQQTEHATCSICGGEMKRSIPETEGFMNLFNPEGLTETESTIIGYIYSILVSLIQTLVSF